MKFFFFFFFFEKIQQHAFLGNIIYPLTVIVLPLMKKYNYNTYRKSFHNIESQYIATSASAINEIIHRKAHAKNL